MRAKIKSKTRRPCLGPTPVPVPQATQESHSVLLLRGLHSKQAGARDWKGASIWGGCGASLGEGVEHGELLKRGRAGLVQHLEHV